MTRADAIQFAITQIPEILPLEQDDVKKLCEQVLTSNKTPETIAQGFLDILGHEDLSFEFVIKFNELLSKKTQTQDDEVTSIVRPPREREFISPLQQDKSTSPLPPPPPSQLKLKPEEKKPLLKKDSTKGTLVSERLTKPPASIKKESMEKSSRKNEQKNKTKKVQSLRDIDDAVKFLELNKEEKNSKKYVCNCQGLRHPIFELAPNCLSCGKIICIKEGLHLNNCSFCGEELIPIGERVQMLEALQNEKDEVTKLDQENKLKAKQSVRKPTKTYKISSGMGKNLFQEQDKLFDFIERKRERERKREEVLNSENNIESMGVSENDSTKNVKEEDKDLIVAQERLNKLLHFQNTSAERTKIIDNASDFSMSNEVGLWGSARERALLLKKQQRNLRKWEKLEKERSGKRDKYVVSMNIGKNGKVTMSEVEKDEKMIADSDDEFEELSDEEDIEDLRAIKSLKKEINEGKELEREALHSSVWDYQEDKKKFERPVYIGDSHPSEDEGENANSKQWKSRVQISTNDDNALEENILAVL
ncbi:Rqt4p NDAI_0B05120 [Naumovozyma dairenensis CBS 421]|uniref:TRIP4/RQT4 C2HC5-type zinc finger domain-containing protein n=1 Tax=Naumovozyma dairenensis (strain ATCC 10597 / BCRC 20456 / CBS 421 / NBRC 0211 / NRRL Y-12639) TaxID=1071378 RepID=G0W6Y4_NAUDC|nr:hypothetical protein NDAI_0B05120 [Naumovozyma dairenensis CBS 421]CCD23545.1 hypothetical protein NDAI_0B05120 [Naumovozyma dairenensis CBS 421]